MYEGNPLEISAAYFENGTKEKDQLSVPFPDFSTSKKYLVRIRGVP